ncbi:MAG: cob(I)yrinic acid a,c-diamide adenosyltransferase [Gorillibacterium sp.]|nr:cob(I)yrinic acid a,c-diamide adenosyltransferase [Gorillibacterium sp.]
MKLYTKSGDKGTTSVIGGRVDKDDTRVEAYGTVDELNSFTGTAISLMDGFAYEDLKKDLIEIQHELFDCGSDLANLTEPIQSFKVSAVMVEHLEELIDQYVTQAPDITRFILPGGSMAASALHVCRTVCRRAERLVVTLTKESEINLEVLRYLNRLSDFFFALARVANAREGLADTEYIRSAEVFGKPSEGTDKS